MKNIIFKSIILLLVLMVSFSCQDKLEELYQDPDGFSKQQADAAGISIIAGYFASECTQSLLLKGEYGPMYHMMRSGTRVMGTGMQLYYTTTDYGVSYGLKDVDASSDWGANAFNQTVFNKLKNEWIKQILWAQYEYNKMSEDGRTDLDELYMKLMQAIKAYAYQRAIDLYEEVPYFETGSAGALDNDEAEYKDQQEIYPIIIEELGEICTYLENLDLSSSELSSFSLQDIIFDGDFDMWIKWINSLRLRCAMAVAEVNPDLTKSTLSEMGSASFLDEYDDVAGIADLDVIDASKLPGQLGVGRAFKEVAVSFRASAKFLDDVMHCTPVEKDTVVNGETLYYFSGDNHEEGLANGTVDPRVAYLFSPDALGRYIGGYSSWDDGTDNNSYYSKLMRAYYINDPIMTDLSVTSITIDLGDDEYTISIGEDDEAYSDLSKRDEYLLSEFRYACSTWDDTNGYPGKYGTFMSEYNVRCFFRYDMDYPTISSIETELFLAEAAVRDFGTINGSAREHYKKAIELSCEYWYHINNDNPYSSSTSPAFPTVCDEKRIEADKPDQKYDASTYAEYAATLFDAMTKQEQVQAIFNQLHLHYNFYGYEICFTTARRLIDYVGTCPAAPYEVFKWKERNFYPPALSSSDPAGWAIVSSHDDTDLPVWFTGRSEKWKNVLE